MKRVGSLVSSYLSQLHEEMTIGSDLPPLRVRQRDVPLVPCVDRWKFIKDVGLERKYQFTDLERRNMFVAYVLDDDARNRVNTQLTITGELVTVIIPVPDNGAPTMIEKTRAVLIDAMKIDADGDVQMSIVA
jgi:hypothetical protein